RTLAEPGRAEFRRALLRLEVDVHEPEAISESCIPLEVVHHAPLEIALDRYALRCRPMELRQVVAQKHDAIRVVELSVGGDYLIAGAPVLGDEDLLRLPERLHELRRPVHRLGTEREPRVEHLRVRLAERYLPPAAGLIRGHHVFGRLVDIDPDEIERRSDDR